MIYQHKKTNKKFQLIKQGKRVSTYYDLPRCKTTVNGWFKFGIDKKSIIRNDNMIQIEDKMKYKPQLGLPYMGSKRKIANEIVNYILKKNKDVKYFYDVFGGGGAISFEAIQKHQIKKVFYNEFNGGVVSLLKDIRDNGITDKYYQFIDRQTFLDNKDKDDFLGGLCKVVWSFGNNQKDYIYGKDTEADKKLLHNVIINKCEDSLKAINDKFDTNISLDNNALFDEDILQRLDKYLKISKNNSNIPEHFERLQHFERLNCLIDLANINLNITNQSYEQVQFTTPPNETIIYLDPPYENTGKYEKDINHKEFYKWVDTLIDKGFKVYISSYECHLPCVLEIEHTSSLSATTTNKVIEKLFCSVDENVSKDIQLSLF